MIKAFQFLIVLTLSFTSPLAYSQFKKPGLTFGANIFYANPQGTFKNAYKGGLGVELKGGVGFGKTYLIATVGYAGFATQANNNSGTLTYMPLKLGLKHYLLAKRLFINGNAGVAHLKNKTMSTPESHLSADIGAGLRLFGMEAGVYYDTWKNSNEAAEKYSTNVLFKLGYNITL